MKRKEAEGQQRRTSVAESLSVVFCGGVSSGRLVVFPPQLISIPCKSISGESASFANLGKQKRDPPSRLAHPLTPPATTPDIALQGLAKLLIDPPPCLNPTFFSLSLWKSNCIDFMLKWLPIFAWKNLIPFNFIAKYFY